MQLGRVALAQVDQREVGVGAGLQAGLGEAEAVGDGGRRDVRRGGRREPLGRLLTPTKGPA